MRIFLLFLAIFLLPTFAQALTCTGDFRAPTQADIDAGLPADRCVDKNWTDPNIKPNQSGAAKAFLLGLRREGSASRDGNIKMLNSTFAICSAQFIDAFQKSTGFRVKITSAYRDAATQRRACPVAVAGKCGKVGSSNHGRGLALDIWSSEGGTPGQKRMWDFAKANPGFGVCFPFEHGDRPHLMLGGVKGSEESAKCARKGITKPCSGGGPINIPPPTIDQKDDGPELPDSEIQYQDDPPGSREASGAPGDGAISGMLSSLFGGGSPGNGGGGAGGSRECAGAEQYCRGGDSGGCMFYMQQCQGQDAFDRDPRANVESCQNAAAACRDGNDQGCQFFARQCSNNPDAFPEQQQQQGIFGALLQKIFNNDNDKSGSGGTSGGTRTATGENGLSGSAPVPNIEVMPPVLGPGGTQIETSAPSSPSVQPPQTNIPRQIEQITISNNENGGMRPIGETTIIELQQNQVRINQPVAIPSIVPLPPPLIYAPSGMNTGEGSFGRTSTGVYGDTDFGGSTLANNGETLSALARARATLEGMLEFISPFSAQRWDNGATWDEMIEE